MSRVSTGIYRCNTNGRFNVRRSPRHYSVTVIGSVAAFPVIADETEAYTEIKFYAPEGELADPEAWSLVIYGEPISYG